jgi:hypothetical protein
MFQDSVCSRDSLPLSGRVHAPASIESATGPLAQEGDIFSTTHSVRMKLLRLLVKMAWGRTMRPQSQEKRRLDLADPTSSS